MCYWYNQTQPLIFTIPIMSRLDPEGQPRGNRRATSKYVPTDPTPEAPQVIEMDIITIKQN